MFDSFSQVLGIASMCFHCVRVTRVAGGGGEEQEDHQPIDAINQVTPHFLE